jgi:hypothetical protein
MCCVEGRSGGINKETIKTSLNFFEDFFSSPRRLLPLSYDGLYVHCFQTAKRACKHFYLFLSARCDIVWSFFEYEEGNRQTELSRSCTVETPQEAFVEHGRTKVDFRSFSKKMMEKHLIRINSLPQCNPCQALLSRIDSTTFSKAEVK